jgi:hypothetical protein
MTASEQLKHIMSAQADLMDAIIDILKNIQGALLRSDGPALERNTAREEELLRPFHDLEAERIRCVASLGAGDVTMNDLLVHLPPEEREEIHFLADRMRVSARRIVELNSQNSVLLGGVQRFIHETLRIVTDDNRRQLVDERV